MILPLSIRDWPAEWRELYEERAGIMQEQDGDMAKKMAEAKAAEDIRKVARETSK